MCYNKAIYHYYYLKKVAIQKTELCSTRGNGEMHLVILYNMLQQVFS
jgi:hypothetical protein